MSGRLELIEGIILSYYKNGSSYEIQMQQLHCYTQNILALLPQHRLFKAYIIIDYATLDSIIIIIIACRIFYNDVLPFYNIYVCNIR